MNFFQTTAAKRVTTQAREGIEIVEHTFFYYSFTR